MNDDKKELGSEKPSNDLNGSNISSVDIESVIVALVAFIQRYIHLTQSQALAVALWAIFTWFHKVATVSPILNISSPQKRCGKSTLMGILQVLVYKPLPASNATMSTIYRSIDAISPTLLVDEADTFVTNNVLFRGVLNAGHYKSTAHILRCQGDNHEVASFSVWSPKAIAGIGSLDDTLQDRSVVISLTRKPQGGQLENFRRAPMDELKSYSEMIAQWASENQEVFETTHPEALDDLNDRANDNWEPLLAIAEMAGPDCLKEAQAAALEISKEVEPELSLGEQLLQHISVVLSNTHYEQIGTISTEALLTLLFNQDDWPWLTCDRGRKLTAHSLSRLLKPYEISPKAIRFVEGVKRGYETGPLLEVCRLYSPATSETTVTLATNTYASNSDFLIK